MRDIDIGKAMHEETIFDAFEDAFSAVLGREILQLPSNGPSPDFEAAINGQNTGVEITELRGADSEDDLFELSLRRRARAT